jgi:TonB family protein
MAPTVKDVENSTSTSTATLPSAQVANAAPAAARPQPIPLEVPVSVNGARTIEGSDKREPFSESTKTVLVFANGAVIRLASNVAPGQLLFVTNDKTKKEVVCQVVKSKNYRTVTGYVELEFTESAPGFWGVRIPTDSAPAAAQPKAPVAQRPAAPPAAISPAIGTPKVAPPAPVATQANVSVAPPAKPVIAPTPVIATAAPKPEAVAPPVQNAAPAPAPPAPVKVDSLSAQLAAQFSALTANEPVLAHSRPAAPEIAKPSAPQKSSDASTEELRQQAARLQEQLSSLLFRESTPEKAAVPAPPATAPQAVAPPPVPLVPKEMLRGADVLEKAVAELEASAKSEVSSEVKLEAKPEPKIEPIKISSPPAPVTELRAPSIVSKASSISLPAEEVKIPSWLAPLARETETAKETTSSPLSTSTATEEIASHSSTNEFSSDISGESSPKAQSVVFGGQLLGGSESTEVQAAASGSKKGLIFGLIAAGVLVAAGVGWYGMQPGNSLASKPAAAAVALNNNAASNAAPSTSDAALSTAAGTPIPPASTSSSVAANNRTATTSPVPAPSVDASRNSNPTSSPASSNSAGRNVSAVEEPKKPVFGDVRLATPNVNRGANADGNVAAPAIDAANGPEAADPLVGLAASNTTGPSAPLPIGGDVKPARLLKTVPPVYPPSAKSQRIAGDVQLDALIDANGTVTATKIISGPTLLHQAAISAVKQWKYAPAQLDGKPTSMHLVVTVQFRLQ